MNKIVGLLKVQMLSFFGINKALYTKGKSDRKGVIGVGLMAVAILILVLGISFLYNAMIAFSFDSMGLVEFYLPIVMTLTCVIILMTTIYKVNGVLFGFKDFDIILSLPIKTSHVVASRVLVLYLMNVLFLGVVMVPAGIMYAIMAKPQVLFYFIYSITLLFIPLIPIIIATFIGAAITFIASRFRYTNLINIVMSLSIIIGVIGLSFGSSNMQGEDLTNLGKVLVDTLSRIYPLAHIYSKAVCQYNIGAALLFIGISLFAFGLFASILGIKFKAIHTALSTTKANKNYQLGELKVSSALGALYSKELKRYFGSSVYVINTAIGIIFLLMLSISLFFLDIGQLDQLLGISNVSYYLGQFAPLIDSLLIVMTCTTACSLSLEGKNLWILKSAPIPAKTIFLSKIGVQLTLAVPAILLNSFLMMIVLRTNLLQSLLLIILPILYTLFMAIMGIVINLKWPDLEWSSEVVVIKQSLATVIGMLTGFLSIIIPGAIVLFIPSINNDMKLMGITVIISILTLMAYRYMNTKGERLFRSL